MLNICDTRHVWVPDIERVAVVQGLPVRRVKRGDPIKDGLYFFIPRQFGKAELMEDKFWFEELREQGCRFIQDDFQVRAYEDKIAQFFRFNKWMPTTAMATTWTGALAMLEGAGFPLISKSAYGSASHNVRLLNSRTEGMAELMCVFDSGLNTRRGHGPDFLQKDYALWQEFIPHKETWRVTLVGSKYHVYKRFNHPDRPMAAPSCVIQTQPVEMCEEVESLLDWASKFFAFAKTKWCAIDVLRDQEGSWRLLETSLAWARGDDPSGNAKFYGSKYSLNTQFSLLIDEIESGEFG